MTYGLGVKSDIVFDSLLNGIVLYKASRQPSITNHFGFVTSDTEHHTQVANDISEIA